MKPDHHSHIDGIFEGYAPGRLYTLADGTSWRQESDRQEKVYRENPVAKVVWEQSIAKYSLDVEGTSSTVWVVPDTAIKMRAGAF